MSIFFYNIFLILFRIGIRIAALFNQKAKKWVSGRHQILQKMEEAFRENKNPVVWMHCASLGEFEQGRPIIEQIKRDYPTHKILLTFFSPSGYEVRKDYQSADWVFYLPMDGADNARRFLEITKPVLVIFVKYEFWYYYLKKVKYRNIPLILVSAIFWKEMSFFKWYGAMQRKMITRFNHLFVQDQVSSKLMEEIGAGAITSVSGDTRFDRVSDIAAKAAPLIAIETFLKGAKAIIAGSTWPDDERVLKRIFNEPEATDMRLILAPHEINEKHLAEIKTLFPSAIYYSELVNNLSSVGDSPILVIDNIGLLSQLYRYAFITYIGGGFGKGIHNILEAAVYGKPVVFGPVYHKFREAKELIQTGAGRSISNETELLLLIKDLENTERYRQLSETAGKYVRDNKGATGKIVNYIQENRLLTN